MPNAEKPNVHVKSYFAASVPDAIQVAQAELGSDALLLNSRPAPLEMRHFGALEVVFGVYGDKRPESGAAPASATPATASAPEERNNEIGELRRKMDQIHNFLVRSSAATPHRSRPARFLEQLLIESGLSSEIAADIEDAVTIRLNRRPTLEISPTRKLQECDPDLVLQETVNELRQRIQVRNEARDITAVVGPPGSGKTSTIVKLAVKEGLMKHRPVRLISADSERVGAAEQLRSYAAILGVSFVYAETTAALAQAIERPPAGCLILIDTPGFSPALLQASGGDLASFLARRQDIDTHLVLTASARPADLEKAVRRFEVFGPSTLIFTHLDETEDTGHLANEAIRSAKAISWLCTGQMIPEDIEPGCVERLTGSLVRQLPELMRSAA
jgi:flagellar biosynthesis protein FlhF